MNRWLRSSMFSFALMLALAVSAFWTVPALADDESPPAAESAESLPPSEEEPSSEELPAETPVIEQVIPEEQDQEETVTEMLASVPERTDVVVVNAEGEIEPLATEEAAQLIEIIDPMWCPVGVNPGAATYSIGYTSLTELVDDFNDGLAGLTTFAPSGNGVIWIEGGADAGTVGTLISISGSDAG